MPSPPRLSDNYQHSGSSLQQSSIGADPLQGLGATPKPIGQGSIGQAPIGQNAAIGQSSVGSSSMGQNSLGQRYHISINEFVNFFCE